ncbi:MAG: YeeE/YedE family protein [Mesorhizobium sp.]|nr:MAG: YeeE/YedE family protein [Mesorhizobium sp.]
MGKLVSAFVIGGLFGLGIAVSGMINPSKVLNFFDIAGTWDPSLIFVMGGGLAVAFVGYRLIFARRKRPVFETAFALPSKKDIDGQLVSGAALFGIGWGIAGFCPGGAIPALGLGRAATLIFVVAMIAGIAVARLARTRLARPAIT